MKTASAALAAFLGLSFAQLAPAADEAALSELQSKGKYLSAAGNCVSCHTTEGGAALAGGLAFETDFGTLYSTNITPDTETGIGSWSLEAFTGAMRRGERPDGTHLYPVFPYTSFTKVSDEDIAAIYAYLKTVTPVRYTPPENELSFPYDQRWALGLWKTLYFTQGRYEPQTAQSAEWNRGAYLVEGLGHCSECHTPRNFLGAKDAELAMTGSAYTERVEGKASVWSASNLTSDNSGLAMWSHEDIAQYLKLGFNERAGVFGPMNNVVVNSTRHLSQTDVDAVATYLKSLPANAQASAGPADDAVLRAGSLQYDIHCGTCHLPTGEGSAETGPPVLGSPVVLDADPSTLINITLYGAQLPETAPSPEWQGRGWKRMESYANKLSDEQVAALLSYMRSAWGHEAGAVTLEQVARQR
ncbi:gluconate 2-dehydrogenase cytochrome c subunit [gamma proteobacterium NOR5-3]|nr:gluconate 2-dehydrogenase cytochrome c subunit [gamma proteobacterium NOR5-3]